MNEMDGMLDQVAEEFLKAVETKDKKMMLEALEALVLHIQDMDEEQDQQEME